MHDVLTDLTKIALVISLAVVLGFAFMRLRQPAIVGYILAGVVLGPTGLALVESSEPMQLLAELGVLALLFVIGMELSIRAFKADEFQRDFQTYRQTTGSDRSTIGDALRAQQEAAAAREKDEEE